MQTTFLHFQEQYVAVFSFPERYKGLLYCFIIVTISLKEADEKMLSFYGADLKYGAEKGTFVAFIGSSSEVDNGIRFELF